MIEQQSHTYLAVGLASCIILAMAAFGLGLYCAFWIYRIKDQVEQVVDAATTSFAEELADEEPETDEIPVVTETREFGGREFRFARH